VIIEIEEKVCNAGYSRRNLSWAILTLQSGQNWHLQRFGVTTYVVKMRLPDFFVLALAMAVWSCLVAAEVHAIEGEPWPAEVIPFPNAPRPCPAEESCPKG